jgi:hypothetical protein
MHCPSLPVPTLALAGALALGCTEQHSPTAPSSGSPPAAVPGFAPGGSQAASVERGTLLAAFWFSDPERGLTTLIGFPGAGISNLSACGGTEEPEPHFAMFVGRGTEAVKLLLKSQETSVAVWQLIVGNTLEDLCGVLGTTAPYAVGTARLRLSDNDASPFPVEPGGNSASLHAHGTVTVVETGEALQYHAISHNTFPPGATSFEDIRILQSEILLH